MQTILRLPRTFDQERLVRDLGAAISAGEFLANRPTYHDGGWKALALVSNGGGTDAESLRMAKGQGDYKKTNIIAKCPYFEEVVDSFGCPVERVRLLRLEPGAKIHEHIDLGDGWAMKRVRLHVPIVTHDEVYFYVDGQRVIMKPGELWYCDFTKPHRVHNKSDIGRVHMVLDVVVDDWLKTLFPDEPLAERVRGWAQRNSFHGKARLREIARKTGLGPILKRFMPKRKKPAIPVQAPD
jgi:quercetin dioxygenase-like cupin family protein